MIYKETGQFKSTYESDHSIFPLIQDKIAFNILMLVAFLVVPFFIDSYWEKAILIPFLIYSMAAIGLNILTGYCGQVSLGTGGFMAVGAFATYKIMTFFPELNAGGTELSSTVIDNTAGNGGKRSFVNEANNKLIFIGCGKANIKNTSTLNASAKSYIIRARDSNNNSVSKTYTFNIIDDDCKGFEKIRLTWLNRLGAWDYYSFTKRNVRTVETQRTSYKQISGLYNESVFMTHGYKGGQKTFYTNAKERVTLNTDFVTESTATWLEELFTSPEVYILNEFSTDGSEGYINKYVQPVTITSSTYTKQTRANDDLLQYTLEIERSKNRVIQNA